MRVFATSFTVLLLLAVTASAEEFVQPQAYPVERYEAVWTKNPFTLKTAPVPVKKESFSKDLAISSIFSFGEDTTVNLVNTKTREFMHLKNKEAQASGIKVKSVNVRDTRSETSVELELNGEAAIVKYDESYLKQIAAVAAQPKAPIPNQAPQAAMPGSPVAHPANTPQPPVPQPVALKPVVVTPPRPQTSPTTNKPSPQERRLLTAPQPRTIFPQRTTP